MLGVMSSMSGMFWDLRTNQIMGGSFGIKWYIDPSGYVYDLDTNQRLQGATTTAYYIPTDDTDDFFSDARKPSNDEYGTVWDASEWSQFNPLITDENGCYAWDVPEGWWRVKYEKFGYDTVWSDWLPVPPPQTEVNIGMKANFAISLADHSEASATVTITNNTDSTALIQYVIAAYDENGKMLATKTETINLASSAPTTATIDFSDSDSVSVLKVFILDSSSQTPLRSSWSTTLQADS